MKLRTLLRWSTAAAVGATLCLGYWLGQVDAANRRTTQLARASQDVARTAAALQSLTLEHLQFGGPRSLQQLTARFDELEQTLRQARHLDAASASLQAMDAQAAALRESFAALSSPIAAEDPAVVSRRRTLLLERFLATAEGFMDSRRAWAEELLVQGEASASTISRALASLPLLVIALLVLGALLFQRAVLRPLEQLQRTARQVEAGILSARSGIQSRNEVGEVAQAVDRMTDSLLQAQERLQVIMATSPLGIFLRDMDRRLVLANPAWYGLAGLPDRPGHDIPLAQVVHPDDMPVVQACIEALLATGENQQSEIRYLRPDGRLVWVRTYLTPMRHGEQWLGAFGIVEDITAHRELLQQLARSNRDLESFAYVASHDLQEPLRMVNSYGQLLQRRFGATLDPKALEFVGHMVDGGARAQELIRALLELARVDSQFKEPVPVPMQRVLDQVTDRQREALAIHGARLTHDELPTLLGNERLLVQLLDNLVSNALKYRGESAPVVHVAARRERDGWHFVVSDNGIGIAPRFHDRVFVMFQRLHQRGERPGTGIGLTICMRVVERHGGRIWVESTPGQGCEFHFTLPDGAGLGAPIAHRAPACKPHRLRDPLAKEA